MNYQTSYDKLVKDYKKLIDRIERAEQHRNEANGQRDVAQRALADLQQSSDQQIRTLTEQLK